MSAAAAQLLELPPAQMREAWRALPMVERRAFSIDDVNRITQIIADEREGEALDEIRFDRPEPGVPKATAQRHKSAPTAAAPSVPIVMDWQALAQRGDPPPREWLIRPWLPRGHTALLAGPGGTGKTRLAQQTCSAGALGADFIAPSAPFTSLMWGCEDDEGEFWRTQADIAAHYRVPLDAFAGKFFMVPRAGEDNVIASSEFGRLMFTPRLEELRQQANDLRVDSVWLDNARHLYLGDENNNAAVTLFLNTLSGALRGIALVLIGHTSRAMGSEYANGAAWENACRVRLYFGERLPDEGGDRDEPPDPNVRILARRKANYAAKDLRRFRFEGGVLVPDAPEEQLGGGVVGHLRTARIERTLLAAARRLAEMNVRFTDAVNSPQYLPRVVLDYKLGEGATKRELSDALRTAMLDGRLVKGIVGKYDNRTPVHGLLVTP